MRRNRTPRTYIWPEQLGGGCLFIELGTGSLFRQSAPDQGNKRMGLGKKGKSILLEEAERVNAMELTEERQRKIRPGNLFRRPPENWAAGWNVVHLKELGYHHFSREAPCPCRAGPVSVWRQLSCLCFYQDDLLLLPQDLALAWP